MGALGIPTTRCASLVVSDVATVARDPQYSGHIIQEPCAVVSRISPSFIRLGSFEVTKQPDPETGRAGPSPGNSPFLAWLVEATIRQYFPTLWAQRCADYELQQLPEEANVLLAHEVTGCASTWDSTVPSDEMSLPGTVRASDPAASTLPPTDSTGSGTYSTLEELSAAWLRVVVARNARLTAGWDAVGWEHAVLNTDNVSVVGVTIDYGPYGWMDATDLDFIANGSDHGGRYRMRNQRNVMAWNFAKTADELAAVLPVDVTPESMAELFVEKYTLAWNTAFAHKLGMFVAGQEVPERVVDLAHAAVQCAHDTRVDWTRFWRMLGRVPAALPDRVRTALHELGAASPLCGADEDTLSACAAALAAECDSPAQAAAAIKLAAPPAQIIQMVCARVQATLATAAPAPARTRHERPCQPSTASNG